MTAEQEIHGIITVETLKRYRDQLFKVAYMRKMVACGLSKGGIPLMREENHLMRLWAQVKPMTAVKTRPAYEHLNKHTPFDKCKFVATYGRLPKGYQDWVQ